MKTAASSPETLLNYLNENGFKPARWDNPSMRQLDLVSDTGHPSLRVASGTGLELLLMGQNRLLSSA